MNSGAAIDGFMQGFLRTYDMLERRKAEKEDREYQRQRDAIDMSLRMAENKRADEYLGLQKEYATRSKEREAKEDKYRDEQLALDKQRLEFEQRKKQEEAEKLARANKLRKFQYLLDPNGPPLAQKDVQEIYADLKEEGIDPIHLAAPETYQAAQIIERAFKGDVPKDQVIGAFNQLVGDSLSKGVGEVTDRDIRLPGGAFVPKGAKIVSKRVVDAVFDGRDTPDVSDDVVYPQLEVTYEVDGKRGTYIAPVTKNRSTNDDDPIKGIHLADIAAKAQGVQAFHKFLEANPAARQRLQKYLGAEYIGMTGEMPDGAGGEKVGAKQQFVQYLLGQGKTLDEAVDMLNNNPARRQREFISLIRTLVSKDNLSVEDATKVARDIFREVGVNIESRGGGGGNAGGGVADVQFDPTKPMPGGEAPTSVDEFLGSIPELSGSK